MKQDNEAKHTTNKTFKKKKEKNQGVAMAKCKSRSQPTYNVVVELSRALRANPQWAKVICKQEQTKIHPQQCERLINSFKQQIHHIIAPERGFKLLSTVLSVS